MFFFGHVVLATIWRALQLYELSNILNTGTILGCCGSLRSLGCSEKSCSRHPPVTCMYALSSFPLFAQCAGIALHPQTQCRHPLHRCGHQGLAHPVSVYCHPCVCMYGIWPTVQHNTFISFGLTQKDMEDIRDHTRCLGELLFLSQVGVVYVAVCWPY